MSTSRRPETSGAPPLVHIVILTWNGRNDTLECLRSLVPVWSDRIRGILVDNGSTDGTAEAVKHEFPDLILLENRENLGFTEGSNVGIRYALDHGTDYVLLLNNDTVVDKGFLRELLQVAARSDRIGFVSPKIYFSDPPDMLWFAGARFYSWCGYGRMVGYREKDCGQYDEVREIDRPCGCAVLVSRRLCEEVGLMDPGIFLYSDEVEWTLRARKKGFEAYYAPQARVWHKVSASVGQEGSPDAMYYGVRNTLHALNSQEPLTSALMGDLRNLLVVMVFLFSTINSRSSARKGFHAVLEGLKDYKASRMGKRGSGLQ